MLEINLRGQRALVAGAGQGIGQACAEALASAGSAVACLDINGDRARQAAAGIEALGTRAIAVVGDARRTEDAQAAVAEVVHVWGGIDIGVDVVGEAHWSPILDTTEQAWDDAFAVVLRHAFLLARSMGRAMVEQGSGGAVVLIGSISGLSAAPLHGAYGAAKAAMSALTKTLAVELAPANVRVNTVAPGTIATPRSLDRYDEGRRSAMTAMVPMRRQGAPEEVASVVAFLASGLASYITGQTLVDGGATVRYPFPTFG
jgi:3-oxoacyl-[acyl-carrier protein] reductase